MQFLEKLQKQLGFTEETCPCCNRRSKGLWGDRRRAETIKNPFSRTLAYTSINTTEQTIRMLPLFAVVVVTVLSAVIFRYLHLRGVL